MSEYYKITIITANVIFNDSFSLLYNRDGSMGSKKKKVSNYIATNF
jgi:hypothetical protein